ncbi:MAG TPA: divalent cation tolerance protein CutA [Spirochaetia bacterium]|nr:divalent cation tolerance protein CutA [Spirochaetia bacterium]
MSDLDPIFVNIPCPTKEEGIKLCGEMLKQEMCGTTKIQEKVRLMWLENGLQDADIVLLSLKTTKEKLPKIQEYVLKNHSWVTPCIEVIPIINDSC